VPRTPVWVDEALTAGLPLPVKLNPVSVAEESVWSQLPVIFIALT